MPTAVTGKLILVTGASSGIGRAAAELLASCGATVVLAARRKEELESVVRGIEAKGGLATAVPVDLADQQQITAMARTILDTVGIPDVIINNAGVGRFQFCQETSVEEYERSMAVPVAASFFVVREFLPKMLERRSGHVINVTSPASFLPWPGATAYASARFAMRGLNEALRMDLSGTDLRVSLVVLGKTRSEYFQNNLDSEVRLPRISRLIQELSPQDAAAVIVRAVRTRRRKIVSPWMLKVLLGVHSYFPRMLEWAVQVTGFRRSGSA